MKLFQAVMENGEVMDDWEKIMKSGLAVKKIEVDIMSLGLKWDDVPKFVFEGYESYFFQKYGVFAVGTGNGGNKWIGFAGFQIGACKKGAYVIFDVSFLEKCIKVFVKNKEEITTNAIVAGVS